MCYYVYVDHAQYTIKTYTYAKMALFPLDLVLRPGLYMGKTAKNCMRAQFNIQYM